MRSEAIPAPDQGEQVGVLLERVITGKLSSQMNDNQRAAIAWHAANGDRERAHTTRVFLKKGRTANADPIICVYVDSHAFLTDLKANCNLYLSRLANWGFYVSGIEFGVDREAYARKSPARVKEAPQEASPQAADQLTPQQRAELEALVKDVPDALKESISRAIAASFLAEGKKQRSAGV